MPDISVAIALLKKPIEVVAGLATGKAKDVLAKLKADSQVRLIYQKLNATQKVKTIWDVDRARSLNTFYFPARIKTSEGQTQTLSKLDELPANAVILSGIVGQGKSILLRYLLGKEMRSGLHIPIFLELRKTPATGLNAYLRYTFNDLLGINGHPEIFDLFASAGRLAILLDGFDEIDPDRLSEIVGAIEELARSYPASRLVVTSRPASGLETSPHFDVVHIAQIAPSDFAAFFTRILPRDKPLADRITKAVLTSPTQVRSLASTPLLATLLTIVYRSSQRIPADFAEFYSDLFEILLVRHDRSKAYDRRRKTAIGDREFQQVFEAFCFKSHADGPSSMTRAKALELAEMSISAQELTCTSDSFLNDVIKVTCLLQEEGGRIEFLHQSVREFFAARYVSTRPNDVAGKFYHLVSSTGRWRSWDQVLRFLSQIDKYRASQQFFIPAIENLLDFLDSLTAVAPTSRLRQLISDQSGVQQVVNQDAAGEIASKYNIFIVAQSHNLYGWDKLQADLYSLFYGPGGIAAGRWIAAFDKKTNGQVRTYSQLAAVCGVEAELDRHLIAAVESIRSELHAHEIGVAVLDSSADFMGL